MSITLFVGIIVGIVLVGGTLLALLILRGRTEYLEDTRLVGEVSAMSVAMARDQALRDLQDTAIFHSVNAPLTGDRLQRVGALLRDFLSQYEEIEVVTNGMTLGWRHVSPSTLESGSIRIGSGDSPSGPGEDFELVVAPSEEVIRELHRGEAAADPVFGTSPTIYHWIVATALESRRALAR